VTDKQTNQPTMTTLNQSQTIFWKGKICKFIKWETLNFGGKLRIQINKNFIEVDIKELSNKIN